MLGCGPAYAAAVAEHAPGVALDLARGISREDRAFRAAVDVWPTEPVPDDSPFRALEGVVLSAHRAGGIPAAFAEIGDMVVDDLELMARGLAPVRLQQAAPELVGRYRTVRPAEPDRDDKRVRAFLLGGSGRGGLS